MKPIDRFILLALCLAAGISLSWSAQQTISIGTTANDGTGDTFRDAFDKVNDNFTELYAAGGNTTIYTTTASTKNIDDSAVETVIYSHTVPAGTLGTSGALLVRLNGKIFNDSGATKGFTVKITYGGTTLYTDSTVSSVIANSSTVNRIWQMDFVLSADNSATAQRMAGSFGPLAGDAATTGYGDLQSALTLVEVPIGGTAAVNSAVDQTLEVLVTLTAASPSYEWTTHKGTTWKL